ncbi:MAG: hypothetical protein DRN15_08270 [Thermoprotei archaeon]|nr:MAG: hypothetical protein DRN15_08270 [Thermoprotei archaeon]
MGKEAKLRRELGIVEAIALCAGIAVGTGVVKLHGPAGALIGPYEVLAWIMAGALATLVYLCFAELGPKYPKSGGMYYFFKDTLGELAGFTFAWSYWMAEAIALGALSLATAESLLLAVGY